MSIDVKQHAIKTVFHGSQGPGDTTIEQ